MRSRKIIRYTKPKEEYRTRIKNFVLIPDRYLPDGLRKADAELVKARAECGKALAKWVKEWKKEWKKADAKRRKAYAKLEKAYAEWPLKEKLALLRKLNPRNTWNGKNIGWK